VCGGVMKRRWGKDGSGKGRVRQRVNQVQEEFHRLCMSSNLNTVTLVTAH